MACFQWHQPHGVELNRNLRARNGLDNGPSILRELSDHE